MPELQFSLEQIYIQPTQSCWLSIIKLEGFPSIFKILKFHGVVGPCVLPRRGGWNDIGEKTCMESSSCSLFLVRKPRSSWHFQKFTLCHMRRGAFLASFTFPLEWIVRLKESVCMCVICCVCFLGRRPGSTKNSPFLPKKAPQLQNSPGKCFSPMRQPHFNSYTYNNYTSFSMQASPCFPYKYSSPCVCGNPRKLTPSASSHVFFRLFIRRRYMLASGLLM